MGVWCQLPDATKRSASALMIKAHARISGHDIPSAVTSPDHQRGTICLDDSTSWAVECSPTGGYRTRVCTRANPVALIRACLGKVGQT